MDAPHERFRFGLFEFDTSTGELRREGLLVHLQSQPARVLSCLILRAGEVVSREELHRAVWGGETFVDFERGLNFCITQLRSVLGDDATNPRYVRTIPRRGYQFIAPVESASSGPEKKVAARVWKFPVRALLVSSAVLLLVGLAFIAGYALRSRKSARPIVAVVRFDNETTDPEISRFSDGLTDNLVEQLTSMSHEHYAVIGNAAILRVPRDHRDLSAIASSLHAGYVVLGQVQSRGAQTRILAHLIRMPDQTHLWVVRMDQPLTNPLELQLDAAGKIAAAFAPRMEKDSSGTRLPPMH